MKTKILVSLLIFSLFLNCKQKQERENSKAEQPVVKTEMVKPLSPVMKELLKFAEVTVSDTTDNKQFFDFKEIDSNGVVTAIGSDKAIMGYKKMMQTTQPAVLPIFEIKNTENVILSVNSKGYFGAVWAKILVNKNTLEVKKIAFGHQAESEGYGAEITYASFEQQFVGAKIDFSGNTYALQQGGNEILTGENNIDGISGGTTTSSAVVTMLNEGLIRYKPFLRP